jgi:hypothetical protein
MAKARRTGGGIQSSVNRKVGIHGGSRTTNVVSPAGLSQYGTAQGGKLKQAGSFTGINSATPVFAGTKPLPVPFGNAKATDVGSGGPGTGRTVMRTGSQSLHGTASGPAAVQGRPIFPEYPPETSSQASLVRRR